MEAILFLFGLACLLILFATRGIAFKKFSRNFLHPSLLPLMATPLGVLWLIPFSVLCLSFFFPLAGHAIYLLSKIYYPDWTEKHFGFFLILLFTSPITAWLGISLLVNSHRANFKLNFSIITVLLFVSTIGSIRFGYNFSQATKAKAIDSVEAIAGSKPYCLQTPGPKPFEYTELSDPDKLTAWALGGSDVFSFLKKARFGRYRVILVVGEKKSAKLFYWSHRAQGFLSGIAEQIPVFCTPKPHFAKNFNLEPIPEKGSLEFAVSNFEFSIPRQFNPFANDSPGFNFYASPPDFQARHIDRSKPIPPSIQVTLQPMDLSKHINNSGYRITFNGEEEYSLKTGTRSHLDRAGVVHSTGNIFHSISDTGVVSTFIECDLTLKAHCVHYFVSDNWTYFFQYPRELLPEWRIMERNLVNLSRSFVVQ